MFFFGFYEFTLGAVLGIIYKVFRSGVQYYMKSHPRVIFRSLDLFIWVTVFNKKGQWGLVIGTNFVLYSLVWVFLLFLSSSSILWDAAAHTDSAWLVWLAPKC